MTPLDQHLIDRELDRIRALRTNLVVNHPFFATLLLPMRIRASLMLPTFAGTNGIDTIWINPVWTSPLSLKQLGYVLLHEVGHCALLHALRKGLRQHRLWNESCDFATNAMIDGVTDEMDRPLYIRPDGIVIPNVGRVSLLHADWAQDLTAEQIYDRLLHEEPLPPAPPASAGIADPATEGRDPNEPDWSRIPCRQGSTCAFAPTTLAQDEAERLTDRIIAAHEAWIASSQRGTLAAGLLRLIDRLRAAKVPWQRVLHQYAGSALARDDYSLTPPHRRWLVEADLVRPGLRSEALGLLVVSVDTSASISRPTLEAFAAEIAKMATLSEEALILTHDAAVHQVVGTNEVPAFLRTLNFRGGGGTSHVPVFDWLRDHRQRPDLLVALTDLCSEFPAARPAFPVLWCVPDLHGDPPAWGRLIVIPDTEES